MAVKKAIADDFIDMGREMFDDMVDPGEKYVVAAVYDEIDGSLVTPEVQYDVRMVLENIADAVDADEFVPGIVRAILLQEELSVVPKQGDGILDVAGVRHNVETWSEDPAHVIWQIDARKE